MRRTTKRVNPLKTPRKNGNGDDELEIATEIDEEPEGAMEKIEEPTST
ncbi:hypothetical protein SAMN05444422_101580 [Halobiforma haloterrestris]|uniref:Uncharacterized protein n=1 Tax=Natronobacterium haloterrestre TaxID=148448 RepID=A0A1I1DF68_NATHA|nr:hypothetical protein SAMN05444422_101580 [Halobiforma haloterrestris]